MKKLTLNLFTFLLLFDLLISCSDSSITDVSSIQNESQAKVSRSFNSNSSILKANVCHNGNIINISTAAISAHQAHGDAVDMDGDGYNIENDCSPVDCDDTTYSEDNTCGPVMWTTSKYDPGVYEYEQMYNYLYTKDNFETLNASANYDEFSKACVLNAPLLSRNGNVSTYDGGVDFGAITLTFQNSTAGKRSYRLTNDGPKRLWSNVDFYDAPLLPIDCLPFSC